jgi:hypothetical protein
MIGADMVAKGAPDGYYHNVSFAWLATNATLYPKGDLYDFIRTSHPSPGVCFGIISTLR